MGDSSSWKHTLQIMPRSKMKPSFSFVFMLSLLLLGSSVSYGRKDLESYWQKKMKGLPMPELIRDLVFQNHPSDSDDGDTDLFVRDFDMKPNVIIYHSHHVSSEYQQMKMKKKKVEADKLFREEDKLAQ